MDSNLRGCFGNCRIFNAEQNVEIAAELYGEQGNRAGGSTGRTL